MAEPDRLLCDTSFVGHVAKRRAKPEKYEHWDAPTLDRIDKAILEISVITLAEARWGYQKANWGSTRINEEEKRLGGFVQVPLDMNIVEEWARLRHFRETSGFVVGDNDIWIAATASTRGLPLVTCDKGQAQLADDPALQVILLEAP